MTYLNVHGTGLGNACREGPLSGLDEASDPALSELVDLWLSRTRDGKVPLRQSLDPFTLKPWLGHISIYEAMDDGDFLVRLEGSAIVDMTGENWTSYRASEIDKKYGTPLTEDLGEVIAAGKPSFHRMMIFQRRHFFASRALLPVRKAAESPANQVFLVLYKDQIQPDD